MTKTSPDRAARIIALLGLADTVDLSTVNKSAIARVFGVNRSTTHRDLADLEEIEKDAEKYLAELKASLYRVRSE